MWGFLLMISVVNFNNMFNSILKLVSLSLFFLSMFLWSKMTNLFLCWSEGSQMSFMINNFMSISLLNPLSSISEQLLIFHDVTVMSILVGIMVAVMLIGSSILWMKETNKLLSQNILMELWWILIPMSILMLIGSPSIKMLYQMEETFPSTKNIFKVTGYQWYWTYETLTSTTNWMEMGLPHDKEISESYMKQEMSSGGGHDSLNNMSSTLELICQSLEPSRFIITSSDVMHSWALPSMFIKVDAIPGRLNQLETIFPPTLGSIYGQCSELCGVNHSFMPIVVDLNTS